MRKARFLGEGDEGLYKVVKNQILNSEVDFGFRAKTCWNLERNKFSWKLGAPTRKAALTLSEDSKALYE